jgi:hypothetical protein
MSLAYVLAGDPRHSRRLQVTGWVWGLLVLSAALTMGLARAMSMRHWLSDSLWIILMAWITMHILYYFVLRVPNQARILERGLEPGPDRFWELGLCLYLFLFILGLMGLALGYRALLIQDPPWLGLLILPGLALGLLAWRRLKAYYQKNIRRALNEDQIWT